MLMDGSSLAQQHKKELEDAAGGPVVKTPYCDCRGAQVQSPGRKARFHMSCAVVKKKKPKTVLWLLEYIRLSVMACKLYLSKVFF